MAYTDPDSVRAILAPGGNPGPGSAASMSDAALQESIDGATDEVDATLAIRYTVPFPDPVPDFISNITRDIAAYLATLTYRQGDPLPAGHPILLRNARAELILGRIASGMISLDVGETPPVPDGGVATVVNLNSDVPFFTKASLGLHDGLTPNPFTRFV